MLKQCGRKQCGMPGMTEEFGLADGRGDRDGAAMAETRERSEAVRLMLRGRGVAFRDRRRASDRGVWWGSRARLEHEPSLRGHNAVRFVHITK
jgi:hypothetical protein